MMDRTAFITGLHLVVLSTAMSSQIRASEYELRWVVPTEEDVAGYKVYIVSGCSYPTSQSDIGSSAPDDNGVAFFPIVLPDDGEEYDIMLTAYRARSVESAFSNAICVRATQGGIQSCTPRTDCRRPEAPN